MTPTAITATTSPIASSARQPRRRRLKKPISELLQVAIANSLRFRQLAALLVGGDQCPGQVFALGHVSERCAQGLDGARSLAARAVVLGQREDKASVHLVDLHAQVLNVT